MKYLAIIAIILLPVFALAQQQYTPLVGITGVTNVNTDFNAYINALYALSIGVAALLAVIKIVIAGVKWMMTDIVTSKSEAKKDIQGALLGLLIVLGAVLIITVINPDILKVNLSMEQATIPTPAPGAGKSAPVTLNTSSYNVNTFSNGSVVTFLEPGLDTTQINLFKSSCTGTVFNVDSSYQCGNPAKNTTLIPVPLDSKSYCDSKSGEWSLNPTTPGYGWCSHI